jgi:DNA modification methylase
MFSFVGDTVLDPFGGTGSTAAAAAGCGRHSISFEIDPTYAAIAHKRLQELSRQMFSTTSVEVTGL